MLDLDDVLNADFQLPPYPHQLREFETGADEPYRALLWQMRSGKTKQVIDNVCHWRVKHGLDAAIIFAPNGVHRNWLERELPTHHWELPYHAIPWDTHVAGKVRERKDEEIDEHEQFWAYVKERLRDPTFTWWAFSSETITRKECRQLLARIVRWKKRIALLVDESDDYGRAGSKKTMMARALANKCVFRRILTGTVIENSPLRAFSQFEIVHPKALGFQRFDSFEHHYALYENRTTRGGRKYPALVSYQNMDELRDHLAKWSSVVLRDDINLPPIIQRDRKFTLTDEQKKAYREVKAGIEIEVAEGTIELNELAAKLIKLQQVTSSYIVDKWQDKHRIAGGNPRLDATMDEIELAGGRCVVWCAFRPEMDAVVKACKRKGLDVLTYHGGTSDSEKKKVREVMAPESTIDQMVVVGHEKSGGRGLNFSRARAIINHSHVMDAVIRSQSVERATEMGGDAIDVVNVRAPGIDDYVLDEILSPKVALADQVARTGLRAVLNRI
ncbi:MAG: hypothetical protein AAFX78_02410 [Cyanobacteria bacterium J06638_20]